MNRTDKGFYVTTISNLVPFMEFHQLNLQMNGLCQETRKKVDTILSIIKLSLVFENYRITSNAMYFVSESCLMKMSETVTIFQKGGSLRYQYLFYSQSKPLVLLTRNHLCKILFSLKASKIKPPKFYIFRILAKIWNRLFFFCEKKNRISKVLLVHLVSTEWGGPHLSNSTKIKIIGDRK